MDLSDAQKILALVSDLKEVKDRSFMNESGLADFKQAIETCRIIDIIILPIFYLWDQYYHRQLNELGFEEHLWIPYQKFLKDPLTKTWELYLFISIKTPFDSIFNNKNLLKDLKELYKQLLDVLAVSRRIEKE